jgi:hypothetical protein
MFLGSYDLIENNKGELVAIDCDFASVKHFEIFSAAALPSPPQVRIEASGTTTFSITTSIYMPESDVTFNLRSIAPQTLRGPVGLPDVTHIAMHLVDKPEIVAIKFRGKWLDCSEIQ